MQANAVQISILGTTTVTTATGDVVDARGLGGEKPRQILEILALAGSTPVSKDQLADLLWDGHPPRSYLGTLESYVCVLRAKLGVRCGRRSAISTVMHGYVLDAGLVEVDLTRFRTLVKQAGEASRTATSALALLREAVDLVQGPLLSTETGASWAEHEREAFRREIVDAATSAAAYAVEAGEHTLAEHLATVAIGVDDLAEASWRLLMRALWAQSRRAEALRMYGRLRHTLSDELGTEPARQTCELYLRILRDEPGTGTTTDPREEVRMLLEMLRRAVTAVPGVEAPRSYRALAMVAAEVARAS